MKSTGNRAYHKDGRSGVMHEQCRGAWFGVFKKILPLIDMYRDEIMGDESMFMTPVPISQQMEAVAYDRGFTTHITLGIYIEWWETAPEALDTNGNRILDFSGNESCLSVDKFGKVIPGTLRYSPDQVWSSFNKVYTKYADTLYVTPLSLSQLLDRWYQPQTNQQPS